MALRQFQAFLDDVATIRLVMEKRFDSEHMSFSLESNDATSQLFIHSCLEVDSLVIYYLTSLHALTLDKDYTIYDQDRNKAELGYGHIVRSTLLNKVIHTMAKTWEQPIDQRQQPLSYGHLFLSKFFLF